jgi:hypothetical protein
MHKNERLDDHQKFKQLCALAQRKELSTPERLELNCHLQVCDSCRQVYQEYSLIAEQGMPFLAAALSPAQEFDSRDQRVARNRLFSSIRETDARDTEGANPALKLVPSRTDRSFVTSFVGARWAVAALAAGMMVAVAAGAYHAGKKVNTTDAGRSVAHSVAWQNFAAQEKAAEETKTSEAFAAQTTQISQLQQQTASKLQELAKLRDALHATETRANELAALNGTTKEQFRQVSEQRDKLATQLHDTELAYQSAQTELTNLRAERDRALLQTASLESRVEEVTSRTREQERQLKDDEQYLASDRDIRELMGARKLYIADVFDVDSGSRTRKPFGRVFYTQSKSLIFYAFDLDREPGFKNASAFQVWGQRDGELTAKSRAMNLGILYMDSETNRRWVLRLEDPKQLEEIDAVFVTVEPHGGSQKPTGKPFLYALLRKEANHP